MVNNKKYGSIIGTALDEYGSALLSLHENTMKKVAKIQKRFLKKKSVIPFIDAFCDNLKEINADFQLVRDTPIAYSKKHNHKIIQKLDHFVSVFFPVHINLEEEDTNWQTSHKAYLNTRMSKGDSDDGKT